MSPCQHFVPTLFSSLAGGGQSHPARFKKWFLLPGKQRKGRQTAEFGLKRVWYLQTSRDGLRHHYCFTSRITELEQSLRIGFYTSVRKPSTHQPQCSDNNEVLSKGPAYCGGPVMKITLTLQKHLRRPCPTIFLTFRNQQARPTSSRQWTFAEVRKQTFNLCFHFLGMSGTPPWRETVWEWTPSPPRQQWLHLGPQGHSSRLSSLIQLPTIHCSREVKFIINVWMSGYA